MTAWASPGACGYFDTSEVCVLMSATPGGGDDFCPPIIASAAWRG